MSEATDRLWAVKIYRIVAGLLPLLILLQALLAGQWMAGNDVMIAHRNGGLLLVALSLLQLGLAALSGSGNGRRRTLLGMAGAMTVLLVIQLQLGFAGFDSPNQARALHIPNGVLLFGLSIANIQLARRSVTPEQERPGGGATMDFRTSAGDDGVGA